MRTVTKEIIVISMLMIIKMMGGPVAVHVKRHSVNQSVDRANHLSVVTVTCLFVIVACLFVMFSCLFVIVNLLLFIHIFPILSDS